MLASQSGSAPVAQTMPQYDTQTGPAATVAAYYINAAAQRLAVPVVAVAPLADSSQQITVNARMDPLADLLGDRLAAAGVSAQATIWLPGDDQPPGFAPARPDGRVPPGDDRAEAVAALVTVPRRHRQGHADRQRRHRLPGRPRPGHADQRRPGDPQLRRVHRPHLQAAQGTYGLPEVYVDASDAARGPESQARGAQELGSHARRCPPRWRFSTGRRGRSAVDYFPGDLATLEVAGVTFTERITRVTVADDRQSGLT
jgi:hypothetical protein